MISAVKFQDGQIATEQDFNNLGAFPRATFDTVIKDLGGFPAGRYAGFHVEAIGQTTIRVGSGRVYKSTGVAHSFEDEGGQTIDLLDFLPALAKRIATIVVWGNEVDTDIEPREFIINIDDGTTEGREVAVESRRIATIDKVLGVENATPVPPAISSDYVAVAQIVLTPTGIESISTIAENKIQSIYSNGVLIDLINARLNAFGSQMDTLRSDMSGLGNALQGKASASIVRGLMEEIARLKDVARLPDDYVAYGADLFLDKDESDTAAAGYAARIMNGLRFPPAGSVTVPIALANPNDPLLKVEGNMALPTHSSEVRLSVVGKDSEYPLTNTTSTTQTTRQISETRQVQVVTGTEKLSVVTVRRKGILMGKPKTYIYKYGTNIRVNEVPSDYVPILLNQSNSDGTVVTSVYEGKKYGVENVTTTREEFVTNTVNVTGSFTAQSFLNSQEGYITGVDLYFSKKATAGDVRVMLVDTDVTGRPMFDRVLEQKVITAADIKIWPEATPVSIKPMHALKGRRYAWVLASSAPHFICQVANNKFAEGALYYFQDGEFIQSNTNLDMAMQVRFAKFESSRLTIGLQPLELAGGIDNIRINADVAIPEGTDIIYEIRNNNEWRPLNEGAADINILLNRPSLVQFRAILIGTRDAMPALGTGVTRSEVTLGRPATNLLHISKVRTLAAPTNTVEVQIRLENWDAASGHTLACELLTGAGYTTVETADATTTETAPDGEAVIKRFTFNVTALSTFKFRLTGAVGASPKTFHISERLDIEF